VKEALRATNLSVSFDEEEDFGIHRELKVESPDLLSTGLHHDQDVQWAARPTDDHNVAT
jgi:hypothetical protein